MLRATLLRLGDQAHMLLLTLHHIAADGWSMAILLRELVALYTAFAEGRSSPLPELRINTPISPSGSAAGSRAELLDRQLGYWKRQLAAAPPLLQLPTDSPATGGADVRRRGRALQHRSRPGANAAPPGPPVRDDPVYDPAGGL